MEIVNHQFSLFGYVKPTGKVPISSARIAEVKKLISEGNGKDAAKVLRDIRYKLQAFEQRINVGQNE